MPDINITRHHALTRQELLPLVEELREKLETRYHVTSTWQDDDNIAFSRQNVTGRIALNDSHLHITMDLPLLLRGFKAKIEDQISSILDKKLA